MLVLIGVLAFGSLVMVLWNAVMPDLFHLPVIDFWHALGLFALAKILFSGFRGGPAGRWRWRKDALKERWANMTPEQQEKFRQEWGRRCGKPFGYDPDETAKRTGDSGAPNQPANPERNI